MSKIDELKLQTGNIDQKRIDQDAWYNLAKKNLEFYVLNDTSGNKRKQLEDAIAEYDRKYAIK